MIKFKKENNVVMADPVRNVSMRLWSPIRCITSPIILVDAYCVHYFLGTWDEKEGMY